MSNEMNECGCDVCGEVFGDFRAIPCANYPVCGNVSVCVNCISAVEDSFETKCKTCVENFEKEVKEFPDIYGEETLKEVQEYKANLNGGIKKFCTA